MPELPRRAALAVLAAGAVSACSGGSPDRPATGTSSRRSLPDPTSAPSGAPSTSAARARQERGVLQSRALRRATDWRLAVPASPRGLAVLLHGKGGDADASFDLGMADHLEAGLAVVTVSGGDTYWHRRLDGSDAGAMVMHELVPLALRRAGLRPSTRIGLMGWSMGGFGSLLLASALGPRRVRGVVACSAAVWEGENDTAPGAFDSVADYRRHTIFGRGRLLSEIPVRLDCGTEDPFIVGNQALARRLTHAETHFEPGGHDNGFWADRARDHLQWLARTPA